MLGTSALYGIRFVNCVPSVPTVNNLEPTVRTEVESRGAVAVGSVTIL